MLIARCWKHLNDSWQNTKTAKINLLFLRPNELEKISIISYGKISNLKKYVQNNHAG